MHLPISILAALPALIHTALAATGTTACNNSPSLCDRAYNNITHLGAHDSPFLRNAETSYSESGNQYYNSTVQLDAGVRLLTAQVHNTNSSDRNAGTWNLCHSSCTLLNAGRLRGWLGEIRTWLEANTDDVVTVLLVNSDDASAADLAGEYRAAGVEDLTYKPFSLTQAPQTWPTLQELIANNTRLVSFVADVTPDQSTAPYLMDEFSFVFENPYDNTAASQLNRCNVDRPSTYANDTQAALGADLMPLMNHFLYNNSASLFGLSIEVPDENSVATTNAASGGLGNLGSHAATCSAAYGRAPTFVLVDFFNVGPAIDTVDALNGVSNATTGRRAVSTAKLSAATSAGSSLAWSQAPGITLVAGLVVVTQLLLRSW